VNSRTARTLTLVVAVLLVVGAVATKLLGGGGDSKGTSTGAQTGTVDVPSDAIRVDFVISPGPDVLLAKPLQEFNDQKVEVNGRRVVVVPQTVSSGAALDAMRQKTLKPTLWSPASSLWGRLYTQQTDTAYLVDRPTSLARTPLVIAMWEPEARALGWPKKPLGWEDILREARNPTAFGRFGHPEWGSFRLGHTNPDFSTSGLSAIAAEYYAATGKTEGLTLADVNRPDVRKQFRDIESSIVHYGDTTLFFEQQLAAHGPAFATAVAMEENTLVDFNLRMRKPGQPKLVAVYPKEGTFYSDNPLYVLKAPWTTPDQRLAAQKVIDYLLKPSVQQQLQKAGYRPSDATANPGPGITAANGADPKQPTRSLSLPDPKVMGRIRTLWHEDRKPADIVAVLDTSGSMQDENKLEQAKAGLRAFLGPLNARDRVALISFSDKATVVQPLTALSPDVRARLRSRINGLFADGGTAIYDTTQTAIDLLKKDGNPNHIQAVVLLTDGQDNKSVTKLDALVAALGRGSEDAHPRVFTIAYGSEASSAELKRIAEATGGQEYDGDPKQIQKVYISISSFF
jgi:Ca-activated chloride channel homolog